MSIWVKLLMTEKSEDLAPEDWKELQGIAWQIYFFGPHDDKEKDAPAKRLRKILGYSSWEDFQKQRQSVSDALHIIVETAAKYKKFKDLGIGITSFYELGDMVKEEIHAELARKKLKKDFIDGIKPHDFEVIRASGTAAKGLSLKKDVDKAFRRLNKTWDDIDSIFEMEYGMTQQDHIAQQHKEDEAREKVKKAFAMPPDEKRKLFKK